MDEETTREMARRMGGGHPVSEIRGKQDFITAEKSKTPVQRKIAEIAASKQKAKDGHG